MKIGLIQIERYGDLIIALPIADWFIRQGHEVYWPVQAGYYTAIQAVAEKVKFIPITPRDGVPLVDALYHLPYETLVNHNCDRIFSLGMTSGCQQYITRLSMSLKFDEYKYAIAGVPFSEKWSLRLNRNLEREKIIYEKFNITRPYICVHDMASGSMGATITLPQKWLEDYQIVKVQQLSDSPFDWIYTLEHAAKLVMVDSCFANLVEQLNIACDKYLITRSQAIATPVFKNGWTFCQWGVPIVENPYPPRKEIS